MFWDKVAFAYDIFADGINRGTNQKLCATVAKEIQPSDKVLECACGTGLLTSVIAGKCDSLLATDFSEKMLARTEKKCKKYANVRFAKADILHLPYEDNRFDASSPRT